MPSRVRNRRTGQWIELPEGDGTIIHPRTGKLIRLEDLKKGAEYRMQMRDQLPAKQRWITCYYGGSAQKPEIGYCGRLLDNSTPSVLEFTSIQLAEELGL